MHRQYFVDIDDTVAQKVSFLQKINFYSFLKEIFQKGNQELSIIEMIVIDMFLIITLFFFRLLFTRIVQEGFIFDGQVLAKE